MSDDRNDDETQTTDKGLVIPVLKREDWERTLDAVIKPAKRDDGSAEDDR
jgi:hypothetical protein